MKLCPTLLLFLCFFSPSNSHSDGCKNVRKIMSQMDVSKAVPLNPIGKAHLCPFRDRTCCDAAVERSLEQRARMDIAGYFTRATRPLLEFLENSTKSIEDSIHDLLTLTEHRVVNDLAHAWHWPNAFRTDAEPAIRRFFQRIRTQRQINAEQNDRMRQGVQESVFELYYDLFPAVFTCIALPGDCTNVDSSYRRCLREHAQAIAPFGSEPEKMASQLSAFLAHLNSVQYLLKEIAFLISDFHVRLRNGTIPEQCVQQFVRMDLCKPCIDSSREILDAKVCKSFCMHMTSQCVQSFSWLKPLDRVVSGMNYFASPDFKTYTNQNEEALLNLSERLREVIDSFVLSQSFEVPERTRHFCGRWTESGPTTEKDSTLKPKIHKNIGLKVWPLVTQVVGRLDREYSSWWSRRLGENLCQESSASDRKCWNGTAFDRFIAPFALGETPAASEAGEPDLETKMQNIHKVLAEARGEQVEKHKDGNSMLIRSTDPKLPEGAYDGYDKTEWIEGSGDWGDWRSPYIHASSDDEDFEGSGSGDYEWIDSTPTNKHLGIKPVWTKPAVPDDKMDEKWKSSETHPDDRSRPKPTGGSSIASLSWRTLFVLLALARWR